MPELVERCIASWHRHMPEWEYRLWTEASLSQTLSPLKGGEDCWLEYMPQYVQEAYEAKKYAFVSDYVRLWALEQEGGVYLDTDVEVLRSFDSLLNDTAFIGLEESLALLPGTCVMGCEAHCQWVKDMLSTYKDAKFLKKDGSMDLTTNVQRLGAKMEIGRASCRERVLFLV